jgi:hypothetical protein
MPPNCRRERVFFSSEKGEGCQVCQLANSAITGVGGTIAGHRFDALVFPEHAENEDYELGQSRISKLWLQRIEDQQTVFNWDRGLDVDAQTDLAQAIVDFLAAGLADSIYA